MNLFHNMGGVVRVEVVSADIPGFLADTNDSGIALWDLEFPDELTARFCVDRNRWRRLAQLGQHRGAAVRCLQRRGCWWRLTSLWKRPVLTAGLALVVATALYLPGRVLMVEVSGNISVPSNQILEAAQTCGIGFWSSRREVRSEAMKNALLDAMPELSWAGVNTYGSRAVITVREREAGEMTEPQIGVSHIVADRDGVIVSCHTEKGVALCAPGQAVKTGDILISGYTDCGLCVTATRSAGEVMAATSRSLTAITPAKCLKRTGPREEKVTYSLIVGKNRINFYKSSGISLSTCGRMVTEYILTLPGNFSLPVKLVKQTITALPVSQSPVDETVARKLLTDFARGYLKQQMIAGTVTEALEAFLNDGECWSLAGNYACTEMIGREQAEQNGELHETSGTNRQRGPGG